MNSFHINHFGRHLCNSGADYFANTFSVERTPRIKWVDEIGCVKHLNDLWNETNKILMLHSQMSLLWEFILKLLCVV